MRKRTKIIPIFVPHLGCPNDCIFCNQKKITSVSTSMTEEKAREIIEEHLETLDSNKFSLEISFFGGTFTGIEKSDQKKLLSVALEYKNARKIDRIRLSTRPDRIDFSIIEILKEHKVDIVELGVQSLDDEVLRLANRGHSAADVKDAVKSLKDNNFTIGIQVMPGLLGTNFLSDLQTLNQVIDLSPDFVRLYPTLVIEGTRLRELYELGQYEPLALEKATEFCKIAYILFKASGIKIIRMGLQPTDGIAWGKDVIAGPFHPAFKSIVLSSFYGDFIESHIFGKKYMNITFEISSSIISFVVGQNKSNVKKYQKHIQGKCSFKSSNIESDNVKIISEDLDGNVHIDMIDSLEYCKIESKKYRT